MNFLNLNLVTLLISTCFIVVTHARNYRHTPAELELTDRVLIDQVDCLKDETPILVHTAAATRGKYYDRRMVIRRTWAREAKDNKMKVIFVIGLPKDGSNSAEQKRLQAEAEKYGDLLQFNFVDDYYNLTLKAIGELKWVAKHCASSRYIIKTDDDVLVNMPAMHQALQNRKIASGLTGKVMSIPAYRQPGQKWYMPRKYYTDSRYTFLLGFTYVLSMDRLDTFLESFNNYQGPFLDIDDLFMTGVLADYGRIKRHNDNRFRFYCGTDVCLMETSLAMVACGESRNNEQMYRLWKQSDTTACFDTFRTDRFQRYLRRFN